jgi:hypothetical protein
MTAAARFPSRPMVLALLAGIACLPSCSSGEKGARTTAAADTTYSGAPTIPSLYSWWSLPDSTTGYYNVDSRVRIDVDPGATSGLSWGAQFNFVGGASAGHVELRDGIERAGRSAYFTFGGATAVNPLSGSTCTLGQFSTVECSLPYDWQRGHVYRLRVWVVNQSAGLWVVAVEDEATKVEQQIGTFTIPGSSLLQAQATTFTNTFFMTGNLSCSSAAPSASATFYAPTGNDLAFSATGFLTTIDPSTCTNVAAFFDCSDGYAIQSINGRPGQSGQHSCN